jgi:2-oxoisovalerate dehydrogenase E1 component beta subunit
MFGGKAETPMVIRTMYGAGIRAASQHSQALYPIFTHIPGLKVVIPSNPYDAKGLLISAIRDNDPVLFFEPKRVYRALKMDVPEGEYSIELSSAKVVREGEHITCVAWGAMLFEAIAAAEEVRAQGVEVELIDLRTLWPVDTDTVVESVKKTGRLLVVHEAPKACGFGAEMIAQICEHAFLHLEAPPRRVTGWDTPFPYTLENEYLPLAHRIAPALVETVRF